MRLPLKRSWQASGRKRAKQTHVAKMHMSIQPPGFTLEIGAEMSATFRQVSTSHDEIVERNEAVSPETREIGVVSSQTILSEDRAYDRNVSISQIHANKTTSYNQAYDFSG